MAVDTYTPLFSEILTKVSKLKTKKEKVAHLRKYNSDALRMVIKSSFDPKIKWSLPEGEVPFIPNDAPEGTEHTDLSYEARKLYHFIQGGDGALPLCCLRKAWHLQIRYHITICIFRYVRFIVVKIIFLYDGEF